MGVNLGMRNLIKIVFISFCFFVFAFFSANLIINLNMKESYANNELDIPIYITENNNVNEVYIDKNYLNNYTLESIIVKDLSDNKDIRVSPINNSFFINGIMEKGREYSLSISLTNKNTKEKINKTFKFNYIDSNFVIKNVSENSCDILFKYNRKNMIFIDSVKVYGKDSRLKDEDNYDFSFEKNLTDISIFKKNLEFKSIPLKPNTTYNINCIVKMKNNVNLVLTKAIKSKSFNITDLNSSMRGENLIELKWDTSSNIKFLEGDSIKIFVKTPNEMNYSDIPNVKITDSGTKKSTINVDRVSKEYEIKLAYNISGKEIYETIKQVNDFYNLSTEVKVSDLNKLSINYSFKNNTKLNNLNGKFNIYLSNTMSDEDPILISSKSIKEVLENGINTLTEENLRINSPYKILYELNYDTNNSIVIKEDSFNTPKFEINDLRTKSDQDKSNLNWSLGCKDFTFDEKDTLKVYVKNGEDAYYGSEPIFARSGDLNNVNSLDIPIGERKSKDGLYNVKMVYTINGIDYPHYLNITMNNEVSEDRDISMLNEVPPEEDEGKRRFYMGVKDQKANAVIFNIYFPEDFEFAKGDSVKVFKKLKDNRASDNYPEVPDYEFLHDPEAEGGMDLSKLTEITADYLVPNKSYDFKVQVNTQKGLPHGVDVPLPIFPEGDNGGDEEEEDTVELQDGSPPGPAEPPAVPEESKPTSISFEFLNQKTKEFKVSEFKVNDIGPNSGDFSWKIEPTDTEFNEKDKVEVYIKRKIVNGYPPKAAFSKLGSEMNRVTSGVGTVSHMNMEYNAKLIYTVSGTRYEQTVDFKTILAKPSCSVSEVTEHSAKLYFIHPKKYIFGEGDALEVYLREKDEDVFPKIPIIRINNMDYYIGDNNLFNFISLKPGMEYEVLVKYLNKANDIGDAKTTFKTKPVTINNCKLDTLKGNKLRVKADFVNDREILDYIDLYVDVFYKPAGSSKYNNVPLITLGRTEEVFDFEFEIPDIYKEYDFLVSYSPHGFFAESGFIEYELHYKCIKPKVEETERFEDNFKYKIYNLIWEYGDAREFTAKDKLNVYLKEIPKEAEGEGMPSESGEKAKSPAPVKVYTFDSNIKNNTNLIIDTFVKDNTNYEVILEVESSKYVIGPGKTTFETKALKESIIPNPSEDIFKEPVVIDDFIGEGDYLTFTVPNIDIVNINTETQTECDIKDVEVSISDDGTVGIKGLVPGKEYSKIEVKIHVEEDKVITFNLENIKLDASDKSQEFLYNVYNRAFLRDPDEGGYKYWIGELKNQKVGARDFLINLLFAEKEFSELQYTTEKFIEILYSIVVDRDPDPEGLNFWIDFYNNVSLVNAQGNVFLAKQHIVDRVINEPEFKNFVEGMGLKY